MNWIKEKLKRFGKWVLGILGIGAVVLALTVPNGATPVVEPYVCDVSLPSVASITAELATADVKYHASIKGCELAKVGTIEKTKVGDYWLEVTKIKPIKDGVELQARVWGSNNEQIGFGKDGTVDLETFRLYNHNIIAKTGTLSLATAIINGKEVEYLKPDLVENAELALKQKIIKIVRYKQQIHDNSKIIPNKVGKTTSSFIPATGTNSPVDGKTAYDGGGSTTVYATAHDAADALSASATNSDFIEARIGKDGGGKWAILRSFILFNTATLPDDDTLDSATVTLTGSILKSEPIDGEVTIISSTPATDADIVVGDYDQFGTTDFVTRINITDWTASADNVFTILSAQLTTAVSKTDLSRYAVMIGHDNDDSEPSVSNGEELRVIFEPADSGADEPELIVEHSAAAAGDGRRRLGAEE